MGQAIRVSAERPYDVLVGHGVLAGLADLTRGRDRIALIHPSAREAEAITLAATVAEEVTLIGVADAEDAKTPASLEASWRALADHGFTRSDLVIGFGGGATTDLAGFVAATWLRGVDYVAVPTTLLAMVDAAVGGKTGINLPEGKNLVGAFYEPRGVFCDLDLLATLPQVEVRAGLAEVIKAGFIADPEILTLVEADPDAARDPAAAVQEELIRRAIAVKASVVSGDLRERTSVGKVVGRELLNYGHTLGHAIERVEDYQWRHGEAISVGMAFVAELSRRLGRLDEATTRRHGDILRSVGLPTSYEQDAWPDLRAAMNLDKKTRGADLRLVVLDALADAAVLVAPDEDELAAAYAAICATTAG